MAEKKAAAKLSLKKKVYKETEKKTAREKGGKEKKEVKHAAAKAKPAAEEKKKIAEKKEVREKIELSPEEKSHYYDIVLFPLITEKAVGAIESQNKLTFVVRKSSTKAEVKKAIEDMFNVKVDKVRILNDMKGRKKAIVSINKQFKADDIATKLGVI